MPHQGRTIVNWARPVTLYILQPESPSTLVQMLLTSHNDAIMYHQPQEGYNLIKCLTLSLRSRLSTWHALLFDADSLASESAAVYHNTYGSAFAKRLSSKRLAMQKSYTSMYSVISSAHKDYVMYGGAWNRL